MEKFNLREFDKNKNGFEFSKFLDDGSLQEQFGTEFGFVEKIYPVDSWFYLYKVFYPNTNIKASGLLFKKGDCRSGIWTFWEEDGKIKNQVDYDKPFKMTFDSILKFLKTQNIIFTKDDAINSIKRFAEENKGVWSVNWRESQGRIETMEISDDDCKILEKSFYPTKEDD